MEKVFWLAGERKTCGPKRAKSGCTIERREGGVFDAKVIRAA